jgi:three-Cys-motif partner protein
MPKDGSVGVSTNTPIKQELFTRYLRWHTTWTEAAMRKHDWIDPCYFYLDLYAGAGASHGNTVFGLPGSPLLALRIAREKQMRMHGHFIEADPAAAAQLRDYLYAEPGMQPSVITDGYVRLEDLLSLYHVYCGDNSRIVTELLAAYAEYLKPEAVYGLLYADPNGSPNFDLLTQCAAALPHVDILLHFPANALKRQRRSPTHPFSQILGDLLETIGKEYWLVRRVEGQWQWTFLFGTNYKGVREWRSAGLCRTDSAQGRAALNDLSYTREELRAQQGQGYLFTH